MLGGQISTMKNFKVLVMMIMLAVLAVGSVVPSFAQDDPQKVKEALYAKYNDNYDSNDVEKRKIAVQAGKEYIQKFGENADDPLVPYFKENIPVLEEAIKKEVEDKKIKEENDKKSAQQNERLKAFSDSIIAKSWAQTFSGGKEVLTNNPKYLDVYIILASIGFDRAVAKDNTYNAEAMEYAKKAIQLINSGESSETKNYGSSFGKDGFYQYKTKDFQDGKENALGWLNFNIGYIMFYNQNKKKEALPYLYEATKHLSLPQKSPDVYRMIGEYYFDEVKRLEIERQGILKTLENIDNEKTLELYALERGYADRGADAYARAYNLQTEAAKKESLLKTFKQLYKFRNNDKEEGADAYLAAIKSKQMPDPGKPVEPIIDPTDVVAPVTDETKPTTTTDKDKPAMTDKKPAATDKTKPMDKPADKPAMDKPATKPAATPTKPSATTKKPVAKTKKS